MVAASGREGGRVGATASGGASSGASITSFITDPCAQPRKSGGTHSLRSRIMFHPLTDLCDCDRLMT